MQVQRSQHRPGRIVPLISPTPETWAQTTARLIVEAAPEATVEARSSIEVLRFQVERTLLPAFEIASSLHVDKIEPLASSCLDKIVALGRGTRWSASFTEGTIQQAIKDLISRNLISSRGQ